MAEIKLDRLKLEKEAKEQILKSKAVQSQLESAGGRIAALATGMAQVKGATYRCRTKVGETRARAFVYTAGWSAIHDNFDNNTLLKAKGRG